MYIIHLLLCEFTVDSFYLNGGVFLPQYTSEKFPILSGKYLAIIIAVYPLAYLVWSLAASRWISDVGRKNTLLFSMAVMVASNLLFFLASFTDSA